MHSVVFTAFIATLAFRVETILARRHLVAVRLIPKNPVVSTRIHSNGGVWMGNDLITILSANQELVVSKANGVLLFHVRDLMSKDLLPECPVYI